MTINGTLDFLRKGVAAPLFNIPGLAYQGIERRKSPTGGAQFILTFESFCSTNVNRLSPAEEAYFLVPSGFAASVSASGAKHTITISTPDDPTGANEPPQLLYELAGNEMNPDLREHQNALALGPSAIRIVDAVLNGDLKTDGSRYSTGDITDPNSQILYKLLAQRNGHAGFYRSQYVFRYNAISSNTNSEAAIIYQNVNCIYSTDGMLAETGAPVGILSKVSQAYETTKPSNAQLILINSDPQLKYSFGWLKRSPTSSVLANGKVQVSGEFWLDIWSNWIYATAS